MFQQSRAYFSLGFAGLMSVLLLIFRPIPQFNYDFEQFFPQDDDDLAFYQNFRNEFENDNDYLLLAIGNPAGDLLDSSFLASTDVLQKKISKLERVDTVISILNLERPVIGIFGLQFGTRNDKEIVKVDPNVSHIKTGWYKDVLWKYYNDDGTVQNERGTYLICDNGYHRWPISISPYASADSGSIEGYFSTNLESIRKDVECTFGILKKRWRVLNDGLYYRDITICEKIFVTCCCLNNFLVDLMTRTNVRVGRGAPIDGDGIWLDGHTTHDSRDASDLALSRKFARRRSLLATHLQVFRQKGAI